MDGADENAGGVSKRSLIGCGKFVEGAGGSNEVLCSTLEGLALPSAALAD